MEEKGDAERRKGSVDVDVEDEYRNGYVCILLTDLYQLTMAYGYFKSNRHNDKSVFELFFRKNPFEGEYTIFAGIGEVIKFLQNFRFTAKEIEYLKTELMKTCDPEFFDYLATISAKDVQVYAVKEGTAVFPKEPLLRIEGPLAIVQLMETTLLNLVNFPSLIATNASRMRLAAGKNKKLLEFGLRRAQGPDGAMTASKYSIVGGFDSTSNVLAGRIYNIPVKGTHAHSFVMAFTNIEELHEKPVMLASQLGGQSVDLGKLALEKRTILQFTTNDGELAAFVHYAAAFPLNFVGLVDTYDTLSSGALNFICVGWALFELGYQPIGIRLDSGDLAYLSRKVRAIFREYDRVISELQKKPVSIFTNCTILASNEINEEVLINLHQQENEIDAFGVGTHLVTCQKQPALGCVYKLVEVNDTPRIKLSQDIEKSIIPGRKRVFRLFTSQSSHPVIDLIQLYDEPPPKEGERILCRHPFQQSKRAYVTPSHVVELLQLVWDGKALDYETDLMKIREYCSEQIASLRDDQKRYLNPTPYKVSVSVKLFDFTHQLWMNEAPIVDLVN